MLSFVSCIGLRDLCVSCVNCVELLSVAAIQSNFWDAAGEVKTCIGIGGDVGGLLNICPQTLERKHL